MNSSNNGAPKGSAWPTILAFMVAYVASRAIFASFGFEYDVFREPFDLGKLSIDFGVWAAVFCATLWGLNRLLGRRSRGG